MKDLKNNKLFIAAAVLFVGLFAIIFLTDKLTDKIADRAVEKIIRDYGPSPYGPGFDPDKIDIEKMRTQQATMRDWSPY